MQNIKTRLYVNMASGQVQDGHHQKNSLAAKKRNWRKITLHPHCRLDANASRPVDELLKGPTHSCSYHHSYYSTTVTVSIIRLMDISWFMRNVNEPIARQANHEDSCTGRFWEGRFKSQALLDEQALAACLTYVDLNPIRAGMATTPESSDHTSVQHRIRSNEPNESGDHSLGSPVLYPFIGNPREPMPKGLPFHFKDYLELVDWTGHIIRDDKRGAISSALLPILERLDIEPKQWLFLATKFESRFKSLVGCTYKLKQAAEKLGYKRVQVLVRVKPYSAR